MIGTYKELMKYRFLSGPEAACYVKELETYKEV
jgi:hypothetical protein